MAIQVINQSQAKGTTLGYAQITSGFSTSSTSAVQATGLTTTVTVPAGGRNVKITAFTNALSNGTAAANVMSIWDGTVGSGTQLAQGQFNTGTAGAPSASNAVAIAVVTPPSGSKTYNIGLSASAGTVTLNASTTSPAFILVELV